jgi:hypothetical protein
MRHYLNWAKLHRRVRFELTGSGVPPARPAHLGVEPLPVVLEVEGSYGNPHFIDAVAELYACPSGRIVPVPGTSSANFISLAVSAKRGSCVMMEHPLYDPLARAASFLGVRVIPIMRRWADGFEVRLDEIRSGLDRGARAIVLTNLHNPSGQYLPPEAVEAIAESCARVNATLILDEVYLDGAHLAGLRERWTAANLAENIIVTSSLTKVYGLGGLRAGWIIAGKDVVDRARDMMDLLSVDNAAPASSLAMRALSNLPTLERRYRRYHKQGQGVFRRWLAGEPLIRGYPNHGALFECVCLPDGVDPDHLNEVLVGHYDTQVVSGGFFGLSDHIRLSIALPQDDLAVALSRISHALRTILGSGGV